MDLIKTIFWSGLKVACAESELMRNIKHFYTFFSQNCHLLTSYGFKPILVYNSTTINWVYWLRNINSFHKIKSVEFETHYILGTKLLKFYVQMPVCK